MKIGVSSFAYRWFVAFSGEEGIQADTAFRLLDKAKEDGAEAIQLCENSRLDLLSAAERKRLVRRAEGLGLELEAGAAGTTGNDAIGVLELGADLGARIARFVIAEGPDAPSLEEVIADFRKVGPAAERLGVSLALENHFRFTPAQIARIVREIGHPRVGVLLDPLNAVVNLFGPQETTDALLPMTISAHVKDVVLRRMNTGFYVSGCPLGRGSFDSRSFLRRLAESGTVASVHVEAWMDRHEDKDATIAAESSWVRDGIAYIRGVLHE